MKKMKFLSIAILFVAILVMPVLAGCAKTYTVDLSITGGNGNGGWIFNKNYTSAYGKSTIQEGEKYAVYIDPSDGYKIGEIKVNGQKYDKVFNPTGYDLALVIEDNTSVEVTFEKYTYNFRIYTANYPAPGVQNGWELYTGYDLMAQRDDIVFLYSGADDVLNPANFSDEIKEYYDAHGGLFYVEDSKGGKTWIDHARGFVVKSGSHEFKTGLSKEQLDEVLRPIYNISFADETTYASSDADAPYGTISVGGNAIDGSQTFKMRENGQFVFSIEIKEGYTIDKITVNNQEITDYVEGKQSYSFTLTVRGSVTYKVTFKQIESIESGS